MLESQGIVFHHHQRLLDVGQNAARNQMTVKPHLSHGEVVEAVDDKGVKAVIELAFQVVSGHHRIDAAGMENAAIDFAVELETFGLAVENGVFWRIVTA